MKDVSLNKAISIVTDAIVQSDIEEFDKLELIMNLYQFLTHYEDVIKQKLGSGSSELENKLSVSKV